MTGHFRKSNFPTTTYGLSLGGTYKKLSISFLYRAKDFSFRARALYRHFCQICNPFISKPGLNWETMQPGLSVNTSEGTNYVDLLADPGDYLRLKTLEIGYSLPRNWGNKLKFQDAKIYTSGYNLFTWSKLSKLYQLIRRPPGNDRSVYPLQRIKYRSFSYFLMIVMV